MASLFTVFQKFFYGKLRLVLSAAFLCKFAAALRHFSRRHDKLEQRRTRLTLFKDVVRQAVPESHAEAQPFLGRAGPKIQTRAGEAEALTGPILFFICVLAGGIASFRYRRFRKLFH